MVITPLIPFRFFDNGREISRGGTCEGQRRLRLAKNGNTDKSKWGGGISQVAIFVVFFARSMNVLHFV